jgi:hypothetical protein
MKTKYNAALFGVGKGQNIVVLNKSLIYIRVERDLWGARYKRSKESWSKMLADEIYVEKQCVILVNWRIVALPPGPILSKASPQSGWPLKKAYRWVRPKKIDCDLESLSRL